MLSGGHILSFYTSVPSLNIVLCRTLQYQSLEDSIPSLALLTYDDFANNSMIDDNLALMFEIPFICNKEKGCNSSLTNHTLY